MNRLMNPNNLEMESRSNSRSVAVKSLKFDSPTTIACISSWTLGLVAETTQQKPYHFLIIFKITSDAISESYFTSDLLHFLNTVVKPESKSVIIETKAT